MKNVWMSQCNECGWIGIDEVDTAVFGGYEENYDVCPDCLDKDLEPHEVHWIVQIPELMWENDFGEVKFYIKDKEFWWEKVFP